VHATGRANGRGQACGGSNDRGRGKGGGPDDLPVRSIQALQQANSIISEITANLNSREGPLQQEDNNNAGNSFGSASYGGRHARFEGQAGRGPRTTSKLSTQTRRTIGSTRTHSNRSPEIVEANSEIDNHADTCCLGSNFLPIYFTGKVCDVAPFLDSMPSESNVEI